MALRIGYDLFSGASQAGIDNSVPGVVQVETAKALKYKLKIQRLADNKEWNTTTGAWATATVAEADELDFEGSVTSSGNVPAIRRISMRIPAEALVGIDADGCIITAYATGDTPSSAGVAMTLAFKPTTL